jgi:hypothetical protein
MKLLFVAMFLLTSAVAFAECDREAQFIGNVKNLKVSQDSFSFQVSATRWYVPSIVCPMDESEFENAVIELPGKPLVSNGQEISGVMVFGQSTQSYRID